MISRKKKIFILVGMVALLVVTGVLNIYLNANADKPTETGGQIQTSFFDGFKSDRTSTRDQSILYLDAIIDNPASEQEAVAEAQSAKVEIVEHMTIENTLEGQIRAVGFDNVVVTSTDQKVTIIVKTEALDEVQVAQLLTLALTETNRTASDIRVIPVN